MGSPEPTVTERSSKFRNVISVDVEDYFHAEALSKVVMPADWEASASRVEANTKNILQLFAELQYGSQR